MAELIGLSLDHPDVKSHMRFVYINTSEISSEISDKEETLTSQLTREEIQTTITILEDRLSVYHADIIRIREDNRQIRTHLKEIDDDIKKYDKLIKEIEEKISVGISDNSKIKLQVILDKYKEYFDSQLVHRQKVVKSINDNVREIKATQAKITEINEELPKLKEALEKTETF
ncbi:hypothetical protein RF11_10867 [Thelohanellus kitauei]|uniref:Uncharacterized protein n=1 Tax=Thelohanellus kitauei TaxID=669202 RepID=A0A0C2JNG1_THEKT|nr:hypothetical protein RF11_10867 [Thelohanellus kitauei]